MPVSLAAALLTVLAMGDTRVEACCYGAPPPSECDLLVGAPLTVEIRDYEGGSVTTPIHIRERCPNADPPRTASQWALSLGLQVSYDDRDNQKDTWYTTDTPIGQECVWTEHEETTETGGGPVDIQWSFAGSAIDETTPGSYTLEVLATEASPECTCVPTVPGTCWTKDPDATDTVVVVVDPAPGCAVTMENAVACAGSSDWAYLTITNTGDEYGTYRWRIKQTSGNPDWFWLCHYIFSWGGCSGCGIEDWESLGFQACGGATLSPGQSEQFGIIVFMEPQAPVGATATFEVEVFDQACNLSCQATATATVVRTDLSYPGLAEEDEMTSPGGLLCVNKDDDNGDGVQDYCQAGPIVDENDLVPISLSAGFTPDDPANAYWSLCGYYGYYFAVWHSPDKSGDPIPNCYPIPWSLYNGIPSTLFIEGLFSGRGEVTLLVHDGDGPHCEDMITITVVDADLRFGLSEAEEENEPGVYIPVNDDFDEEDDDEDRISLEPTHVTCEEGSTVQVVTQDMHSFQVVIGPGDDTFLEQITAHLVGDRAKLRIFAVNPLCDTECPDTGEYTCWKEIGADYNLAAGLLHSTGEIHGWHLWAEGIEPGRVTMELEVSGENVLCPDKAVATVVKVDVDVDSDNDGTLNRSQAEDNQELTPPGVIVVLNNNDDDEDGITDWADGYDLIAGNADDDINPNENDFVELVVEISEPVDPEVAYLRFTYSSMDPATPPQGSSGGSLVRIWKKPGNVARDKRSALDGGDWVAPGEYTDLKKLSSDGCQAERVMHFWLEGVATGHSRIIRVELDPDGPGQRGAYVHEDSVRFRVVPVDLDVDTNRNGIITDDEDDDIDEHRWSHSRGAIVLANCDDDNKVSGTSTQIGAYVLEDSSQSWFPNQWQNGFVSISQPGPWQGFWAVVTGNDSSGLALEGWQPTGHGIPPSGLGYRLSDLRDAATDWVDGPNDSEDMAQIVIRPMGELPAGWSVELRRTPAAAAFMRVWVDEDLDGDHHLDGDEDLNGNGLLDPDEDQDGDGSLDREEDLNGNGSLDTHEDFNNNGILDTGEDLNGNGRLDYIGACVLGPQNCTYCDGHDYATITSLAVHGGILYVEALSFPTIEFSPPELPLVMCLIRANVQEVACDRVRLRVAPWLMLDHTRAAEQVMAVHVHAGVQYEDNEPFLTALEDAAGPIRRINGRAYDQDRWIQDQIEIGYTQAPYKSFHVVLNSPRNRGPGLRAFGYHELLGPDFGYIKLPGPPNDTHASFGNLELSPPVTVNGAVYPLGRIVHGTMPTAITDFLQAQEIQSPVEVNTSFLRVGHVDEIFSFIPGAGSQGFRVAVASPQRALDIMQLMIAQGHGTSPLATPPNPPSEELETIAFLLGPNAPAEMNQAYNLTIEANISSSRTTLQIGLGLDPATDYLWVPVWFEKFGAATAYSAGLVNGLYPLLTAFVPPMTHGPSEQPGGPSRFEQDMNSEFQAAGLWPPAYVPDWHWYHHWRGEVHCGTNSVRQMPVTYWWGSP
ncbi:MAG: hypothetical protein GXY55_00795 [Phycisphaerae bacterium]|nr:hypothetical protein [Phycisphaerae bacterium]